ncbi:extracellular solute-binding protein, partial [Adlercreutzia equolifaciens]
MPTLKYYFVADKANPEDVELVQDALNEAIASKIGAKVELNPLSFAEVTTKLPLILTTGDDADVISISQFAPYITSYQTGGLLALDDLLQKEAPELYKMYDETIWDSEKIKGNIYMVPCYYPGVSYPGMWPAKERTDKYGF